MRSGMVWLLASAAAICTAMACSGDEDEGQVTNSALPNQPGVGGSGGSGGSSSAAPMTAVAPTPGGNTETPATRPQVPATNGAAAGTADAGAGQEPLADAGPGEAAADAAPPANPPPANPPPANPPPANPPPANPPPANPPPAADVGFSDVFPVLVASCGGCHGANAPGNRPRFAQAGNEAASLTAALAASQGATVADRIIVRGVTQRNMPPACGGAALGTGACLDVAEAALIQAWVDQGSQP
ncbi:MAG: hypothetical protein RL033_723 [Pseudomonadota bacterium]